MSNKATPVDVRRGVSGRGWTKPAFMKKKARAKTKFARRSNKERRLRMRK